MSEENNSPVPLSNEVFQQAFEAAYKGPSSAPAEADVISPEPDESTDIQDTSSGNEVESEAEGAGSEPEATDESSEQAETSDEELSETVKEITVRGKDGKRKNIKVDFSDHDKMTKFVQKAANAVRLQSERDALQAQVGKLQEAQTAMEQLQEIIDTRGFEGLIDQLNAEQGGFEAWMSSKLARHEQRLHASEEEIARLDAEDKATEYERRIQRMEKLQEERERKLAEERDQVEISRLQSQIDPIYFKYTFDGKLGDSVAEQRHNKAMFREVTETLDELAEQGVRITPSIIEREFRSYASPLLKGVNRKVRQNTAKAVAKKKAEATTHAQQQVRKGYSDDGSMQKALESPNWIQNLANLAVTGKLKK